MLLRAMPPIRVLAVLLLFLAIFLFAIVRAVLSMDCGLCRRGQKIFGHDIKPDAMGVSSGFCSNRSAALAADRTGSLQQRGEAAADRCPVR